MTSGDNLKRSTCARWGEFEFDLSQRELRRSGLKVKLQPMVAHVLALLVERPGEIVTRDELHHRIWNGYAYSDFDHNLNIAITKLRAALNDPARTPRFIETIPQSGYRFIAPLEVRGGATVPMPAAPTEAAPNRVHYALGAVAVLCLLLLAGALALGRRSTPDAFPKNATGTPAAGMNVILPGHVGGPFRFSGSGVDFVRVPNNSLLEPPHVTVDAWVRSSESPGSFRYLVAKGAQECIGGSYALYTGENGGLTFYVAGWTGEPDGYLSPDAGAGVWDGKWHHVAGSFDGAAVRLFVDGVEVPHATPTPHDFRIGYDLPTDNDLLIGNYAGSCSAPFRGEIDDVNVFGRALTVREIRETFNREAAVRTAAPAANVGGSASPQCAPLPAGAVAWWAAEGGFEDLSGRLIGKPVGPVGFAPGKVGQGLLFPSRGARLVIPHSSSLDFSGPMTIEGWMRFHGLATGSDADKLVPVIAKWPGSNPVNGGYGLFVDVVGRPAFRTGTQSGRLWQVRGPRSLPLRRFSHVAGVVESGRMLLYVDGVMVSASPLPGEIGREGSPLVLGGLGLAPQAGEDFSGLLDEATLYNRALSTAEIQSIFVAGPKGKCLPASARLAFPARWNGPSRFDGTAASHVRIPNSPQLEPETVSVEAWVRSSQPPALFSYVVAKGANECSEASYAIYTGSSRALRFYVSDWKAMPSAFASPEARENIWDGRWHHVVGTFDGSKVRFFVDGHQAGDGTQAPPGFRIRYELPQDNDLLIGGFGGCKGVYGPFKGEIEGITVFNHALTPQEIANAFRVQAARRNSSAGLATE